MHEAKGHEENSFLTLTLDKDHVKEGVSKTTGNIRLTLDPSDLTLFWKRLRKAGHDVRYFACGEYGDKLNRPHYHACVFGYTPQDKKLYTIKNGHRLYRSDMLDAIWQLGDVRIGDVTFESASYVARYVMKKQTGKAKQYYEDEGIEPEFVRMSRRPGLGSKFYDEFKTDIFPSDSIVVRGKHQTRPPRYYSTKLEKNDPVLYEHIKAKRTEAQNKNEEAFNVRRLAVKERVKLAQTKNLNRIDPE